MELHHCINFLLSASQNNVFRYLSAKLAPFGITPAQYGVLSCLWNDYGSNPKQIADKLRLEASSVSSILDRMQKSGLIDRCIGSDDRRTIQVVATQKGKDLQVSVEQVIEQVNQDFFNMLGDSDVSKEQLIKTLLVIADSSPE